MVEEIQADTADTVESLTESLVLNNASLAIANNIYTTENQNLIYG